MACSLRPVSDGMSTVVCERCGDYFAGNSYRVISERDGEKLLDMVVCYGCCLDASQLGLDTEAVKIGQVAVH
jgi:hypothetical protein